MPVSYILLSGIFRRLPPALFILLLVIATTAQTLPNNLSFRGTQADLQSLRHYDISPAQLPPPKATASADNGPDVTAPPENAALHLPPGFNINPFAEGDFHDARWMALAPNGDVFVAEAGSGRITVLRPNQSNTGVAKRFTFTKGLTLPFGMAFWRNYLYVADTNEILRFPYKPGQTQTESKPEHITDLPGRGYNQHWTRDVLFSSDGSKMFVTVGSQTNDSVEKDPRRAAISEYNPDGSGQRIYASGLRNAVGVTLNPSNGELWAAVNERDGLGDNLPPDYVTSVQDGGFYGWPYAYIGPHPDPRHKNERPDLVKKTIVPEVLVEAHSAALGIHFYQGKMFPAEYQGDALVALHGSWNRSQRTGYKIIRIRFKNGSPVGGYEDFITGWSPGPNSKKVWGRPVGLLELKDGSLLITDDGGAKIWRVSYQAKK